MTEFLESFLTKFPGAKRHGAGAMVKCPAHDDRRASLSINPGTDGRVLCFCHAGCRTEDVVAALGLQMRDLMPPGTWCPPTAAPKAPTTKPEAEVLDPRVTPPIGTIRGIEREAGTLRAWVEFQCVPPPGIDQAAAFAFVNLAGKPVKVGDRLRLADGETVAPPGLVYWTTADGPATDVPLSKLEYDGCQSGAE